MGCAQGQRKKFPDYSKNTTFPLAFLRPAVYNEENKNSRRNIIMKYGFGIDLGGTTVKIAYFDEQGTMLSKWEIPTVTADGG